MTRVRGWRARVLSAVAAASVLAAACTEEPPDDAAAVSSSDEGGATGTTTTSEGVVGQFAGEPWFAGTVPDGPVEATGEPIVLGHINQEDVPIGSFPEVRLATETAVDFINAELGGIGGRPIELLVCKANFSIEQSQKCAQDFVQADVLAVIGGLDITSSGSIPILEQNGIPYIGGIPANFDEMQSEISFQFGGGTPGAMVAFASDAVESGAERVAVVYADFGPVASAAQDYAIPVLEAGGVAVDEVTYPITATDMVPVVTQAVRNDPDAILMFAADEACLRTMEAHAGMESRARVYMVGSCAAPEIIEQAGTMADNFLFSVESAVGIPTDLVDLPLYEEAAVRYGSTDFDALSAGTVTFQATMNLWKVLNEIGVDGLTREAVVAEMEAAVEEPSFNAHPYTCDGDQLAGLPALCAPQQLLIKVVDGELVRHSDGWIDVPAIMRAVDD